MGTPNRGKLLRTGVHFPSPAAVSIFVSELVENRPVSGGSKSESPSNSITVQTLNIGTKLRVRGTDNGGVLELFVVNGCWKSQMQWASPSPVVPLASS
jgi:hypothetical protein